MTYDISFKAFKTSGEFVGDGALRIITEKPIDTDGKSLAFHRMCLEYARTIGMSCSYVAITKCEEPSFIKIATLDNSLVSDDLLERYESLKKKTMTFTDIQNEVIKKYRIDICDGTKCDDDWSRTHAHPKKRRVCKWKQASSIVSTLTLFHEIGHIENNSSSMRRCEEEYYATVWAIAKLKEYGIIDKVADSTKKLYQDYIYSERDRGIRRGGKNYPTKEQLTLEW